MIPTIEQLRSSGILAPLDAHFAHAMGRIGGESRPEVLLAAALVSRHVSYGHVCLDLTRLSATAIPADDAGTPVPDYEWPALSAWAETLRSSPLVGSGDAPTPLVLDAVGRLYLRRYWEHEARLAAAIHARAVQFDTSVDPANLRHSASRLFSAAASAAPDWQRIAALVAAQRRFCVISGGPGTGKTFTVVKLLALLIEQALHARRPAPRMILVAPTGKAAARLVESIRTAKVGLDCSEDVQRAIPDAAATIHRCLGSINGSDTRFRHHAGNLLLADVVLVDEASMVDVALMARLIEAVPPESRLILLGDQDQLASVEAGAVLGDICNTGMPHTYSTTAVERLVALTDERLPSDASAPHDTGIWDCIVQLTHSYRYRADSGIGALARAINEGDVRAALDVLDAGGDVSLVEPTPDGRLGDHLRRAAIDGFGHYLRAADPAAKLRGLDRFRVLCAHRRGRFGLELVNQQIETALRDADLLDAMAGRPIIVTRNDYQMQLFNGDVGLVFEAPSPDAPPYAMFLGADGTLRQVSVARLPAHEPVFAMSVHKSQGSEFDDVAVLLPDQISPVLSRELLYTAVTRARQKVTLYATREIVAQAIARRIERASGLRERLWGSGV